MMLEMDLHSHLRRALGPAARTYQNLPEPTRNLPKPTRCNLNLSEPSWEVRKASLDHGLPPGAVVSSTMPVSEAVMRGRARAGPFQRHRPVDTTPPPPGAVLYMDFTATNLVPSMKHRYTCYCGVVDAGSGYARAFPTHGATKEAATAALSAFISDISAVMGLSMPIKPQIINTDQGAAFISAYFHEFVTDRQAKLRFSSTYTPQQNAFVERMWGYSFATARVLLAAASLPPKLHPYALQTAIWIHNRLPRPSRNNQSPFFILGRKPASLAHLHVFGCLAEVRIHNAHREGDRHFTDRGAQSIYLGPSEISSGHVVFLIDAQKIQTHAHIRVWEDRFPGLRGERYDWFVDGDTAAQHEGPGALIPDSTAPPPLCNIHNDNVNGLPVTSKGNSGGGESTARQPLPNAEPAPPPSVVESRLPPPPPSNDEGLPLPPTSAPPTPAGRRSSRLATLPPKNYAGQDEGPRRPWASFADPTVSYRGHAFVATTAVQNFCFSAIANHHLEHRLDTPTFAFATSINDITDSFGYTLPRHGGYDPTVTSAYALAITVQPTTDMGDVPIPKGFRRAMQSEHSTYWSEAVNKELSGLIARGTWEPMLASAVPNGSNVMRCHYIFTVKRKSDGSVDRFKARLVADGNSQKYKVDFDRVFAAVVRPTTLRLILAIAAAKDYNLTQIDVVQAYLQAEVTESLYMRMPEGLPSFDDDGRPLVVKLKRGLYGCKQSGRLWSETLAAFLIG